jgi:hypothetical protein
MSNALPMDCICVLVSETNCSGITGSKSLGPRDIKKREIMLIKTQKTL